MLTNTKYDGETNYPYVVAMDAEAAELYCKLISGNASFVSARSRMQLMLQHYNKQYCKTCGQEIKAK